MDFEFKKNTLDGSFRTLFSSGHEAIGHWLIEEIGTDAEKIDAMLLQLRDHKSVVTEWRSVGKEWSIFIEQNEVRICANALLGDELEEEEQWDESLSSYDEESESWCGIEDLEQVLHSWRAFVR